LTAGARWFPQRKRKRRKGRGALVKGYPASGISWWKIGTAHGTIPGVNNSEEGKGCGGKGGKKINPDWEKKQDLLEKGKTSRVDLLKKKRWGFG